jgi:predicted small metal-binding protein
MIRGTIPKEQTMKVLRCRDGGFDCNQAIRAHSEEEVMRLAGEQAQTQHALHVTAEMETKVRRHIHDENQPPLTSPTP